MKIGSLFSGYGGLDMGVQQAIGGTVAWHCEFDENPSRILAHHWPDVPNYGDITATDFTQVEQVDVLTGGFPCQDVSHAGRRKGLIRDGEGRTRSGLWGHMLRAINEQRPALVVAENVRGLLSATADSDVEPCTWCMGDGTGSPLRALGAVLADLADIGYDAAWCGLRAADVGAPHGRFRVFILAWPRDTPPDATDAGVASLAGALGTPLDREGHQPGGEGATPLTLLRTPTAQLAVNGGSQHPDKRRDGGHGPTLADEVEHLLPTPAAQEPGGTPEQYHHRLRAHDGRDSSFLPLSMAVQLLPTPRAGDGEKGGPNQRGSSGDVVYLSAFGDYAPAIARWEHALGRPAPAPTEPTGKGGAHRLSPRFVEWLMGLPAGHVSNVPDLGRNAQLKALGNGVVPQQAAAALRWLLSVRSTVLSGEAAA